MWVKDSLWPSIRTVRKFRSPKSKSLVGIRTEPWEISNCQSISLFLLLASNINHVLINYWQINNKSKIEITWVGVSFKVTKEKSSIRKKVGTLLLRKPKDENSTTLRRKDNLLFGKPSRNITDRDGYLSDTPLTTDNRGIFPISTDIVRCIRYIIGFSAAKVHH